MQKIMELQCIMELQRTILRALMTKRIQTIRTILQAFTTQNHPPFTTNQDPASGFNCVATDGIEIEYVRSTDIDLQGGCRDGNECDSTKVDQRSNYNAPLDLNNEKRPIRRIGDIEGEYSGRCQTWSLLQETPNSRIQDLGYAVFNWKTAKYGKIWYDEDVHDLRSVETEFPAVVFNETLTSDEVLSCEPTVSSLNNKIDFRISFDESDDEDYTVIFDKTSFSYKIIYLNDLKMNSENDNDKVNMPSFPSPEPTVSYSNDLDFLKDFEKEFPAIVYNDALTSKLDFLTEPTVIPQHIDEFDLKDEASLSECDEEEQNVLNFNDLFPFNVIYPNDSKSDKENDDNKVDIEHSSGDLSVKP
ncbi:hypothetical protein Tco_0140916 [Tanacetum coccineum]